MDSLPYSKDELAFAADLETASPFRFPTQLLERNPRRKLALCELLDHERGCGRLDLPVLQIFFPWKQINELERNPSSAVNFAIRLRVYVPDNTRHRFTLRAFLRNVSLRQRLHLL
jgi:hypothetical protein